MKQDLTIEIYDASKPPEIRALRKMGVGDLEGRLATARELVQAGFTLDPFIDVAPYHPLWVMASRLQLGELYWPNFGQPQPITIINAAGVGLRAVNYDLSQPFPGAIKSSTDAADYLPFDPAPVITPAPSVGPYIGNGEWGADLSVVWSHGIWAFRKGDSIQHTGVREGQNWSGTLYFDIWYLFGGPAARWLETKP